MRRRPSARLIVLDPEGRLLLFQFSHSRGPLAGSTYWATPGGAVEEGETFEDAAVREMFEETGIKVPSVGRQIGERTFVLQLADGENVTAEERLFLVRVEDGTLSRDGWTTEERELMTDHRWWSLDELANTTDLVYPEDIAAMIAAAGVVPTARKSV